ncbi:MAG: serine/threonine-protein kinase, partial [Myxococcota bacterium]
MDPSYQALMTLFDEAADLPADELSSFLAEVERHHSALAQPLVELLAADRAETTERWLAGLDTLQQGIERIISMADSMPPGVDEPDEAPFSKGTVIGQYELIRPLARGGAGDVYLARDVRLGRRVAIKLLRHDLQAEAAADRFLAEARITALCKHENIVVIHDVGRLPGYSYMVLEYVEGITLRDWIDHHWQSGDLSSCVSTDPYSGDERSTVHSFRVSVRQALSLIVPVVRALVHAHSLGMVHRDLKPENIMIAEDGPLKVLDFGIAKLLDEETRLQAQILNIRWLDEAKRFYTRTGFLTGTLPYMSP